MRMVKGKSHYAHKSNIFGQNWPLTLVLLKYSYHESKTIFTSCMIHEGSFKLVIINLSSNHTCWSFLSIFIFFEDSMSGCHHGGSLVSDVNGDREDETVWIVQMILHSSLVPNFISGLVINFTEVTEKLHFYTRCFIDWERTEF